MKISAIEKICQEGKIENAMENRGLSGGWG